jgi:serine/threonine protein kinase
VRFLSDKIVGRLREVGDYPDLGATKYRLEGLLGRGGMGSVYLVEDTELGRRVALKVLGDPDPDGKLSERLLREARHLARLEHPNIVPVHDVGRLPDGRVYYVMKYIRGERLDRWRHGDPGRGAILRMFRNICQAVAFAHDRGVVHRDLKPENVMIGSFGEAVVMDWGVAKALDRRPGAARQEGATPAAAVNGAPLHVPDGNAAQPTRDGETAVRTDERAAAEPAPDPETSRHDPEGGTTAPVPCPGATDASGAGEPGAPGRGTAHGTVMGTPAYMAPEQARGEVDRIDERTDVYALGALLYFLLSGTHPSDTVAPTRSPGEATWAPVMPVRQLDGSIPRPLESICARAMAERPEDRYPGPGAIAADVDRFLDGLPVEAHAETWPERIARFVTRHRVVILLILAYLVMRLAVLFLAPR